jgi:hypothetical protein
MPCPHHRQHCRATLSHTGDLAQRRGEVLISLSDDDVGQRGQVLVELADLVLDERVVVARALNVVVDLPRARQAQEERGGGLG